MNYNFLGMCNKTYIYYTLPNSCFSWFLALKKTSKKELLGGLVSSGKSENSAGIQKATPSWRTDELLSHETVNFSERGRHLHCPSLSLTSLLKCPRPCLNLPTPPSCTRLRKARMGLPSFLCLALPLLPGNVSWMQTFTSPAPPSTAWGQGLNICPDFNNSSLF